MPDDESIYDLFQKVRNHPDYVFGTIFTTDDFPDGVPDDFNGDYATDHMAEAGNEYIEWGTD